MSLSVSEPVSSARLVVDKLLAKLENVHAILLYGPEGAGMEQYALELSQAWLCNAPKTDGPCQECTACKAFETKRLIDFMHVKPWGPQNLIKTGALRTTKPDDPEAPQPPMIEFLRTSPMMAKRKVVLFESAHRLVSEGANTLLKTLEEPPKYAKIILTTTELSRVLPTIRSRCIGIACSYEGVQTDDPVLLTWGSTPGLVKQIEAAKPHYDALWNLFESSFGAPHGAAVAMAERCRELAEPLGKAIGASTRFGQAELLRCLAIWLLHRRPDRPELSQTTVEIHRLIIGNINAGASFDHLWAQILAY